MKLNKNIHLLIISLLLLFSACVGKIEEASVPITNQFANDPIYFDYKGLETATAISNDKVELSFDVASGALTDIEYKLYVNDAKEGVTLGLETLSTHFKGRYYYMVRGLDINTLYNFKVRAFNKVTGAQSKQESIKSVRTYNNKVSDFGGVINLKLVPGQEDDAVEVLWERVPFVFMFLEGKQDPVNYEIVYSSIGPEEIFNSKSTLRTIVSVPTDLPTDHPNSKVIKNLDPNKTYYFAVRAIHRGYQEYVDLGASYIPLDRERNTKFLSIKTSGAISWTNAVAANFNIQNARGEGGYKDVVLSWDRAQGSFSGYKIIYKKYTGQLSDINAYQFTRAEIDSITSSANTPEQGVVVCLSSPNPCPGGNTQQTLKNLTTGARYHFKLFVCEGTDAACPIIKEDNISFVKSYDIKNIQVRPSLATFMGINSIASPTSSLDYSEITLEFSPPDTVTGWADTMKFFCVDTNDILKKQYELTTLPLTNAGKCTGLKRANFLDTSISTLTQMKVSGTTIGEEYCFTASPEFNDPPFIGSEAVRIPETDRIKRCLYPEIITPNISQFPGLNSCTTQGDVKKITTSWNLPTGGIYQDYVLFWKQKTSTSTPFSFTTAMEQYKSSGLIIRSSCDGENYCFSKISGLSYQTPVALDHGSYELGVLSLIKLQQGGTDFYKWSQVNTSVKRCEVLLPNATFKSWTRIFAIGPKENHLNPDNDKYTDEAMTFSGIPFEVGTTSQVDPFFQPPGQGYAVQTSTEGVQSIDISGSFDGIKSSGKLGGTNGIISFAWEDFGLDNVIDEAVSSSWKTESDSTLRQNRSYGYKVYRSKDNRITWEDVSPTNIIHARDFNYRNRPTEGLTYKRMAFFTDYTVKNLETSKVDNVDVDQARIYWYKVVPIFKKTALALTNPQMAMVKITLPPPNMALVHRWMANRSQCLELGLTPDPNNNYTCTFTGVGAIPKSTPFLAGNTKIDLRGDLLIDRFELGCNYTRGDPQNQAIPNFPSELSFNSSTFNRKGCYKVATSDNSLSGDKFTLSSENPLPSQIDKPQNPNTPPSSSSNLKEFLIYGDCLGNSSFNYPGSRCSSTVASYTNGAANSGPFNTPGFKNIYSFATPDNPGSCETDDIRTLIKGFEWSKENLAQSTFGAVYHNSLPGSVNSLPVVMNKNGQYESVSTSSYLTASCSINLAAINAGEYLPRWVDLNTMDGKLHANITLNKSSVDILNETQSGLYDNDMLVAPTSNSTTPIGKLMTSNKAGIPPLNFIQRDTGKKLCSLYKVRQAYKAADSTGSVETGVGPVLDKRYLRRREFVAATMWPEKYDEAEIEFLEGARGTNDNSYANILPPNKGGKSCNNDETAGPSNSPIRWTKIPEKFSSSLPFISGSTNTHQCISKYGIQDLVGNQEEASNEVLLCDYSPIELRWGRCSGGSRAVNGKCPEIVDVDPHVVLNQNYLSNNLFYMLSQGQLSGTSRRFSITNNKVPVEEDLKIERGVAGGTTQMDTTGDDWGYYIKTEINAGYCSFIDKDNSRRSTYQSWAQDYFSDFFFKTLNANLVPLQNEDPIAPYTVRDGSGYFLDFGPNHMTTPLRDSGNLSLPWSFGDYNGVQRGKITKSTIENYPLFSTLLGLPLMCESNLSGGWGDSCNEHNVQVMEKNTFELVDALNSASYVFPASVSNLYQTNIPNFFIGGSTFNSSGLTDVTSYPVTITPSASLPTNVPNIITGLTINVDGSQTVSKNTVDQFDTGANLKYFVVNWQIQRDQELFLVQGGHGNKNLNSGYNGRFSLNIKPGENGSVSEGIRCGVMINENE